MLDDTISAISTPIGVGGISIIRLSGKDSLNILEKIFKAYYKQTDDKGPIQKEVKKLKSHTVTYGYIVDNMSNQDNNIINNEIIKDNIIDEVLVTVMKAPNTYTKEDMIEINCHGGYLITRRILEVTLKYGARLAEPGEFTKRAFLNGRLELTQAESVIDIIHSKTMTSADVALGNLRGDLRDQISKLKEMLIDVISHVNVVIDYPEEGIDEPLPQNLCNNLQEVLNKINILIKSYDKGKKIKEGIKTVIVGKPNVGKSSILNAFLREERAIVTHIPGTTRDTLEEVINIKDLSLVLVDTAGIRESGDIIENIGVERSKNKINEADLILFIIDGSGDLEEEDIKIYEYIINNKYIKEENIKDKKSGKDKINNKKIIGIINKNDLEEKAQINKFSDINKWIRISAKNLIGINEMEEEIYNYIKEEEIKDLNSNEIIITNIRHKIALEKTKQSILDVFKILEDKMPLDLIAIDLKEAIDSLSEITGEITTEDILDNIFKKFCVGK